MTNYITNPAVYERRIELLGMRKEVLDHQLEINEITDIEYLDAAAKVVAEIWEYQDAIADLHNEYQQDKEINKELDELLREFHCLLN